MSVFDLPEPRSSLKIATVHRVEQHPSRRSALRHAIPRLPPVIAALIVASVALILVGLDRNPDAPAPIQVLPTSQTAPVTEATRLPQPAAPIPPTSVAITTVPPPPVTSPPSVLATGSLPDRP